MNQNAAQFFIGQIVLHLKFNYRGVIFDIDPEFAGSEEWYKAMQRSHPPKDRPWYHVLVDKAGRTTYVAERHLALDASGLPISHPLADKLFSGIRNGVYIGNTPYN